MNDNNRHLTVQDILSRLQGVGQRGQGWRALCPAHDDHQPSLDIDIGDNGRPLLICRSRGCKYEAILGALGLRHFAPSHQTPQQKSTLAKPRNLKPKGKGWKSLDEAITVVGKNLGTHFKTWMYVDAFGNAVGAVARWNGVDDKTFRQFVFIDGLWYASGLPEPTPLYALHLLKKTKDPKFIVEGEKAADALLELGLIATTSPGGSNAAYKADWSPLAGEETVLSPDNDEPGEKYTAEVGSILLSLSPAARVSTLRLPGLPPKGDAYDFIVAARAAGETDDSIKDRFLSLARNAVPFVAKKQQLLQEPTYEWARPEPLGLDIPPPVFPVELLPKWLRRFVLEVAIATQTPVAAVAMLALAAIAGGLAGKVRYRIRAGFFKHANIFAVVAMDPGERKSAIFRFIITPIFEAQQAAEELSKPQIAERTAEKEILQAKLKRLQTEAAREKDKAAAERLQIEVRTLATEIETFTIPKVPVFIVDDDTPESIARTLIEQGGRLMQASAEGTAFEIASGRYSDQENFDVYLKGHDGDHMSIGRIGRGRISHPSPVLTCALAVQPDVLQGLARSQKAKARGVLARWLYAVPTPQVGYRQICPNPASPSALNDYKQHLRKIWHLPLSDAPNEIPFSTEADGELANFERRIEPRLREGEDLAGLAAWGTKLAGEVARLAGLLHIADAEDPVPPGPVSGVAVKKAIRLADEFLIPHAMRAFCMMHTDPIETLTLRAMRWLLRHTEVRTVTKRDLFQGLKGGQSDLKTDDLSPVLERLVAANYLRLLPPANTSGRQSEQYEINPLWDRTINEQAIPQIPQGDDNASTDVTDLGDMGDGQEQTQPQDEEPYLVLEPPTANVKTFRPKGRVA